MPQRSAFRCKFAVRNTALTKDGLEDTESMFVVIRDGDGHGVGGGPALHKHMTAATPYFYKSMLCENLTDLVSGEDPEVTHGSLRIASQQLPCSFAGGSPERPRIPGIIRHFPRD